MGCGLPAAGSGGSRTRRGGGVVAAPRSEARARGQPMSHQGEPGVTFLISVGISIVGEELSGLTRRRRGRRDGCFLLVSYQDASTQPPQPFHFTASVRPAGVGSLRLPILCSQL